MVILTFNSESTLPGTLDAARCISDDIHVVDSFSTDRTCEIAADFGAQVCVHEFVDYSAQRNWAIRNLRLAHEWEMHLDADERITPELASELRCLGERTDSVQVNGYYVPRLVRFLGREIRHGGMYPIWHLRLFRRGLGRCEMRRYDQHFLVEGITRKLHGPIIDDIRMPIAEWITRHNRWSDAEVEELCDRNVRPDVIQPRLFGSPVERKRYLKWLYLKAPPLFRAFALFGYRYVVRMGVLDGTEGAIFFALQAFCFRMVVDAKIFERSLETRRVSGSTALEPRDCPFPKRRRRSSIEKIPSSPPPQH